MIMPLVELQFTDLIGILRSVTRSFKSLESVEALFDGSSVAGFVDIESSDLVLRPASKVFNKIPWRPNVLRAICKVYTGNRRFSRDPRYIAEKLEEYVKSIGYNVLVGVEVEYFIINKVKLSFKPPHIMSIELGSSEELFIGKKRGYYMPSPLDAVYAIRDETIKILREYFNIEIVSTHHEVAAMGQGEFSIKATTPVELADNIQTLKYVLRNVAKQHNHVAVFMPKLIPEDNGSGMHIHLSLWDKDFTKNLFYDPSDEYAYLSQTARYFIGGLIEHARSLSAIVSPTVNSYRRLVPGYEAPVYLTWSKGNRSAAIRVPLPLGSNIRIEYRPPDPSANPYLALSAIVLAGIDGIRKKIDPGEPLDINVYKLSVKDMKKLGIKILPRSLDEALDELEVDNEYLKPVFTNDVINTYIELKRKEILSLKQYPSIAEYSYYLSF